MGQIYLLWQFWRGDRCNCQNMLGQNKLCNWKGRSLSGKSEL